MNWERVRLGEAFEFQKKSKTKAGEGLDKGEYPFYTSSEILSKFLNEYHYEGDALIFGTGGKASVHYNEDKFSVSTDCFVIKPQNDDVFVKYVYYYLSGNIYLLEEGFKGAGLKHISKEYLSQIEIPLPPMSVQKEIVEKLDKAAAIREKSKALLSRYDALAESLFIELFGDPISNEKGWEKTNIKDICHIKGGKRVPLKHKLVKYDTGLPYIKAGNIKNGKITLDDLEYLLPETQKMIARYIVDEGDVCITVAGTIGNVGIVPKELDKANLTENANKFVIKHEERLSNYFLCYLFQTEFIQEQIRKRTMAVGVPKLAIFRIEELEIPLPPLSLQIKFAEMVENIEEQKARAKAEIEQSEAVFQALLQESFG